MTKEIIDNDPYKSAGVDIDAGNDLVDMIKKDVASSYGPNVLGNIGGFAGMFRLDKDYENPILVACTDGVGTKVALAQEAGRLEGIGQDLVAMCVNDLIVCGAKPLFFLDYFASSKLKVEEASTVIKSIANDKKNFLYYNYPINQSLTVCPSTLNIIMLLLLLVFGGSFFYVRVKK